MTERYMADNVETCDGRRTEGDATVIQKSSCFDAKHTVPVLVASSPQAVSPINPSEEQEEEHGHPILKSPVTINSRPRSKFHVGALDPSQGQLLGVISHFWETSIPQVRDLCVSGAPQNITVICDITVGLYKPGCNGN